MFRDIRIFFILLRSKDELDYKRRLHNAGLFHKVELGYYWCKGADNYKECD